MELDKYWFNSEKLKNKLIKNKNRKVKKYKLKELVNKEVESDSLFIITLLSTTI